MPLLGQSKLKEYVVILDDSDDIRTEYVLAPSSEEAAWIAMELSENRNCTLKDVRISDEW